LVGEHWPQLTSQLDSTEGRLGVECAAARRAPHTRVDCWAVAAMNGVP
jgi:hypothetical protein